MKVIATISPTGELVVVVVGSGVVVVVVVVGSGVVVVASVVVGVVAGVVVGPDDNLEMFIWTKLTAWMTYLS